MTVTLVLFLWGNGAMGNESNPKLARQILDDQDFNAVLTKARQLLESGFTAGTHYQEVWIRDLATFMDLSCEVADHESIRNALLVFFKFQGPSGDIVDGFVPVEQARQGYKYRSAALAPEYKAHKNTVETDQETSLVQAVHTYVRATGDEGILMESFAGKTVLARLMLALSYLLQERYSAEHGLLWGATTADWGDVQPEHAWGVEIDDQTHRAVDIYDNAMFVIAIRDLLDLISEDTPEWKYWSGIQEGIQRQIRQHLWDEAAQKFVPHLYLEGSPFPDDFAENDIFYHGGTAVAIEAGVLSRAEIARSLAKMRENVRACGAASIGLTLYPTYPQGFFKNPSMRPYGYQNGGDWTWFGGRMAQQLIRNGFVEEAYDELKPMVQRVLKNGGFFEWYTIYNEPRGAGSYRGSAGVLGKAILMLRAWAKVELEESDK